MTVGNDASLIKWKKDEEEGTKYRTPLPLLAGGSSCCPDEVWRGVEHLFDDISTFYTWQMLSPVDVAIQVALGGTRFF